MLHHSCLYCLQPDSFDDRTVQELNANNLCTAITLNLNIQPERTSIPKLKFQFESLSGKPFTSMRNLLLQSKWSPGNSTILQGASCSGVNGPGTAYLGGPIHFVTRLQLDLCAEEFIKKPFLPANSQENQASQPGRGSLRKSFQHVINCGFWTAVCLQIYIPKSK